MISISPLSYSVCPWCSKLKRQFIDIGLHLNKILYISQAAMLTIQITDSSGRCRTIISGSAKVKPTPIWRVQRSLQNEAITTRVERKTSAIDFFSRCWTSILNHTVNRAKLNTFHNNDFYIFGVLYIDGHCINCGFHSCNRLNGVATLVHVQQWTRNAD